MFDLSGRTALVPEPRAESAGPSMGQLHSRAPHSARRPTLEAHRPGEARGAGQGRCCRFGRSRSARGTVAALRPTGGLDVLVNNAGHSGQSPLRMKDEDWQTVLEVNLTAVFRLIRAALRGMMRRRWGRIVNVTSIVALTGNPGQANYAAAKAGMIGMTKSLAAEVASRGITVNCVAPGFIQTPMTEMLMPSRARARSRSQSDSATPRM